jgi:hypothetical protein
VLKHCAANIKRRLSALPNVGPYIYDVKICGVTRSSIYTYDISRLRAKHHTPGNNPKDYTQHLEHGEKLKSTFILFENNFSFLNKREKNYKIKKIFSQTLHPIFLDAMYIPGHKGQVQYAVTLGSLMRIFGPKRDKVTGELRKLHNEECHNLHSSPNIVLVIKSRQIRWAGRVDRMGREEVCTGFWWGNIRERDHWGDKGVDAMIILRWIFKN